MTDLSLLCTAAGHADAHGYFFLIQCCGAGVWVKRCLVPCAINFVRGQLREPTAPLLKVDSNHVWHAWQVEHNGWIQHNSSVRVCCQIKVVHPACSYEALIFGFHRELLISPSLASTWRPLNKFFDPIYTISVSKSSGLLSRLPRLCIDNSFLIIFYIETA